LQKGHAVGRQHTGIRPDLQRRRHRLLLAGRKGALQRGAARSVTIHLHSHSAHTNEDARGDPAALGVHAQAFLMPDQRCGNGIVCAESNTRVSTRDRAASGRTQRRHDVERR
jgi:hypothetical protein